MSGSSHAATCPRNPWRHWQARKRNSPALRSQDRDRLRRPRHPSQEKKTKRRSPPSPPEGPTISPPITSYTTTSDLTEQLGAIRLGAGKRARLRFNARVVLERLESQDAEPASTPAPPTQWVDEGDLIPIRGLKRSDREERP